MKYKAKPGETQSRGIPAAHEQYRRIISILILIECIRLQINYTSVWKPTLMDITHLRHELEMLTSKHAHVCGDNAKLRHDLKQTRSDMLAALDRIHKLATLNEPHQTFVANMMRERNYWQVRQVIPTGPPDCILALQYEGELVFVVLNSSHQENDKVGFVVVTGWN